MKISEIIRRMEERHVKLDPSRRTCDGIIYGDADRECTGIVLTCWPSTAVIRKAAERGCNFILCHEPTFYQGWDDTEWLGDDRVCSAKKRLLDETGIVIYRNHDHVHSERPDMILDGIRKKFGWEEYSADDGIFYPASKYTLPETTLGELAAFVAEKLGLDGMRFLGDPKMKVRNVGIFAHFFGSEMDQHGINYIEKNDLDVVIPMETVDWTIIEYIDDSNALGCPRGLLNVGHFSLEEPGMEMMADWLAEAIGEDVPMCFIQSGGCFKWMDFKK